MAILYNESQFQAPAHDVRAVDGKVARAGVTIYDACGVNACAMAEGALSGAYTNTMYLFGKMAPRGLCDVSGRTVIEHIQAMARLDGFVSSDADLIPFTSAGVPEAVWRHFLASHTAAGAKVIVETLEGCELEDYVTSDREDATLSGATRLQRHFFLVHAANVAATLPDLFPGHTNLPHGYVCSDGCNNFVNPVVGGKRTRITGPGATRPVYYAYESVRSARPAALVALYPKPKPAPAPTPTPAPNAALKAALQDALVALQRALAAL